MNPETRKDEMKSITATVTVGGSEYRATVHDGTVTVDARMPEGRWEWAGSGRWDGAITDCAAPIGEDVYEALDDALATRIKAFDHSQ